MDYSELIYGYLEGELQIAEEQKLFSAMAYDDALREEFSGQIKLNNLFAVDNNSETAPIEVTDKIFSQLGFSIPTSASRGYFGGLFNRVGKTASIAFLLLLTLLSTAGSYLIYDHYFGNGSLGIAEGNESENRSIPVVKSSASDVYTKSFDGSLSFVDDVRSYLSKFYNMIEDSRSFTNLFDKSDAMASANGFESVNSQSNGNFDQNSANMVMNNFGLIRNSNGADFPVNGFMINSSPVRNSIVIVPLADNWNEFLENNRFSISTKGAFNNHYPSVPQFSVQEFNSFEIAVWYNKGRNSFGVQGGRQAFAQDFTTDNGLNYLQVPDIYWVGASYKRYLLNNDIFGFIAPYSSVMAGATSIGPVFRLESGFEFKITNGVQVLLGLEGNSLMYNVDNKIYNSNKLGVIYGLQYSF